MSICAKPMTMDDLHGDVEVASVTVSLSRAMNMAISGTITDETYILMMLESAAEYLRNQKARRELSEGNRLVVPGYDTAMHRTPQERALIEARHQVADAMGGT